MTQHLTTAQFSQKVFDFSRNTAWKFEGERPCIVDFYADWCGPCRRLAPVLDELATQYAGKLDIYKIDTEAEPQVAALFGVQSIPSLLLVPSQGDPQMAVGALPKAELERAIADVLHVTAD